MELRDIEIFLTLAEELHFGRTAERLHVSVARVSQAIKKQERALGTLLFDRDSRNVRLTPVGQQLHEDLRQVYQGLQHSMDKARLAAQGKTAALRVGMMPNNIHELRPYWDTFRAQYPQWGLRILHAPFTDPFAGLRRGEIDILITWLPVEEPDLTVGPMLFEEPRVLAVSRDHELTDYSSVSVEMVSDFQHIGIESAPDYWFDGYIPLETPKGRSIERGSAVQHLEGAFMLTSLGETVTLFPIQVTRYWPRPDIVYLPVRDMTALPYALVWRSEAENDLIRAFAGIVRDLGPLIS